MDAGTVGDQQGPMPEAGAGLGQVRNGKQPCAAIGAMRSGRKEITSFVDPGFQSLFLFILKVSLYLSVAGLSCSRQGLSLQFAGSTSLTRDRTPASCIGSLSHWIHQGSPLRGLSLSDRVARRGLHFKGPLGGCMGTRP